MENLRLLISNSNRYCILILSLVVKNIIQNIETEFPIKQNCIRSIQGENQN